MTQAIASTDTSYKDLLMIAAGGLLSGLLTPLTPQLIDRIVGGSGNLRMALVAVPFAVLVFLVVRRCSANPVWAALVASVGHHGRFRLRGERRDLLSTGRPMAPPRSCATCCRVSRAVSSVRA